MYLEFIEKCKSKKYENQIIHKHHIIPSHIDKNNNTIELSVDDHAQAHLLFANIWPKNTYEWAANIWSYQILSRENDYNRLNDIKDSRKGKLNPFSGKKHSAETRQKISLKAYYQKDNNLSYENRYGSKAQKERDKRSIGVKKYWDNCGCDEKNSRSKNISKSLKESVKNKRGNNPASKKCKYKGKIYSCLQDVIEETGLSRYRLLKNKEFKII